jgi:DNA-binding HxlR family transcriptional regulator
MSSAVLPGRRARGSRSGRPIMVLLDLLGRRMTLRILWELSMAPGPLTFRALQMAAGTNPSVLNSRLGELRRARLVEHGDGGYRLSTTGRSLLALILPLHAWAERWAADVKPTSVAPLGARRT